VTVTPEPTDLDRSIAFQAVFNVRDLGGLRTREGRLVRRGRAFRADGVNRLDGPDLEVARSLGLRTVVDLRTLGEVERHGRFPVEHLPVRWYHLPVLQGMWSEQELVATDGPVPFLRDRYLDMLIEGGAAITRSIELAADEAPLLFHCAAGKDRTGVVAAVLLGLLDVRHEDIADDYHLSAAAMESFVQWIRLQHPQALDAMTNQPREYLEAPAEAMLAFLEEVDRRHGSMAGLAAHLGVPDEVVHRLRASLLDDRDETAVA
jgi:protein-tyrosine phosphatase